MPRNTNIEHHTRTHSSKYSKEANVIIEDYSHMNKELEKQRAKLDMYIQKRKEELKKQQQIA